MLPPPSSKHSDHLPKAGSGGDGEGTKAPIDLPFGPGCLSLLKLWDVAPHPPARPSQRSFATLLDVKSGLFSFKLHLFLVISPSKFACSLLFCVCMCVACCG